MGLQHRLASVRRLDLPRLDLVLHLRVLRVQPHHVRYVQFRADEGDESSESPRGGFQDRPGRRWTRIATNQVENFPVAIFVFWAVADFDAANYSNYTAYFFGGYVALRILFLI